MTYAVLSRRGLLLGASIAALCAGGRRARGQTPDQGIGGTGVAPGAEDRDQGIGGTGVIGTIRRFGSIVVNDMRIAYPTDALVRIDGEPARADALKIGQVVRVVAISGPDGLSTRTIDVTSEVVGPIERTSAAGMIVLGQTVATGELPAAFAGRPGEMVAVSGLRRPDGTIVASLIEPRPNGYALVAGPVTRARDGSLRIGGQRLGGLDPGLIGRRVVTEVTGPAGAYVAVNPAAAENPFGPRVTRLSVEAYVERSGGGLRLGSGLVVGGSGALGLPATGAVRAVLATSVGANGRLMVTGLHIDPGHGRTGAPGGHEAPRGGARDGARPPGAGQGAPRRQDDRPGGFGNRPGRGAGGFGPGPGDGGFGAEPGGGGPGGGGRRR